MARTGTVSMNLPNFSFGKVSILAGGICLAMLFSISVFAQNATKDDFTLLDESEYRGEIEEVVVVGRQPEWRRKIDQEAEWRPERFKLPENSSPSSRIQWLPEYTEDERNSYQGVRDRTGEKASLKLFEWKF
jgi:hypothetical protein|tara:strand:- start:112 stop:507 length:396 start_codon:yes stop_codon:yes gene_type:complete